MWQILGPFFEKVTTFEDFSAISLFLDLIFFETSVR